jgi:hypothetical protein
MAKDPRGVATPPLSVTPWGHFLLKRSAISDDPRSPTECGDHEASDFDRVSLDALTFLYGKTDVGRWTLEMAAER